ncbi:uncharacterized protein LOC123314902 isoform X1 [Coccinella septempunctata]|uniref:uncharacterized protein LOC123314902 isoform X1 n=1 Tax=Coccinella septempunctata TaxID=41139 RepID=UPI001D063122|nr:uncharacterized protein LOC123314902 isoform X1 [Coccinella septempunctata]
MGAWLCRKWVLCEVETHSNGENLIHSNEFANEEASNCSNRQDLNSDNVIPQNEKVTQSTYARSKFQDREDSNREHVNNTKSKNTSQSTDQYQGTTTSIFFVEEYQNETKKDNHKTIKVPPCITIPAGYFDSNRKNVATRLDTSKLTKPKLHRKHNYVNSNIEGPLKMLYNCPGNFTNNQKGTLSNYGDESCDSKKGVVQSHSTSVNSITPINVQKNSFDPHYYPAYSQISISPSDVYRILPVSPKECRIIKRKITNKHIIIDNIEKIDNEYLESRYHIKKMQKLKYFSHIDELELFHVTKLENADSICRNNFNWRFADTKTWHKFGKGVYFSCNAMYAANYSGSGNEKVMFIAKVLVGKKCLGAQRMKIPEEGYDTCGKNQSDILVVKYEDNEFYPAYKIKFHISPDYVSRNRSE